MTDTDLARQLISRLARLDADAGRGQGLNPAQRMALEYLARANRFSRQPSHVAEYMGSTRGTISQTLKTLREKRLISELRSETDRRSLSYDLTPKGRKVLTNSSALSRAFTDLSAKELGQLERSLQVVLNTSLRSNGFKPFGVCKTCQHFDPRGDGGFCKLLRLPLAPAETEQVCVENVPA
ncbi:MAG: MarR family winged helix-turn-helix transcriptional regulator [Henriciella sp.]